MSKYTPGPWKWLDYPDGRKLLTGTNNAVIHCPGGPMNVSIKDMAVIAAAPDLLEACEQALDDHQGREAPTHLINAIAKAKGENDG